VVAGKNSGQRRSMCGKAPRFIAPASARQQVSRRFDSIAFHG
jgi:hypothetical protein